MYRVQGVGLLAAVVGFAAAAPSWARSGGQGAPLTEYATQHYQLKTDLERSEARAYGQHMDQVFAAYAQRFEHFGRPARQRMSLYLFQRRQDYLSYLAEQGLKAANTAGVFFVTERGSGLASFVEDQPRSKVFAVLQHEGFHQFAWHCLGPDLPMWVNEGLAQYFEAAIVVRGKMRLGVPDAHGLAVVQAALEAKATMPFESLLSMERQRWNEVLTSQPEAAGLLYAQSWSMIYFLIKGQGGRLQPLLERYLQQISDGKGSESAFREVFGDDAAGLERRWRSYVAALRPDPINVAVERLEFLAEALGYLKRRGETMPRTLGELKDALRQRGFEVTRTVGGIERTMKAKEESAFEYTLATGGRRDFQLLEPEAEGLPPRLAAGGLRPEPVLVWSRHGEAIAWDIGYR